MITPALKVEAYITPGLDFQDGSAVTFQSEVIYQLNTNAWTDISADVADRDVSWTRGIRGASVLDRTASTGTLTFYLDNSDRCSGGVAGYYSPRNTNVRDGWEEQVKVRVGLSDSSYDSGSVGYKFYGWVNKIEPTSGKFNSKEVRVTVQDYISILNSFDQVKTVAMLTDETSDAAYDAIVAAITKQPEGTNFSAGVDTLPYILHRSGEKSSSAFEEINRIATSVLDYVFISGGGVLTSQNRHDRIKKTTQFTISDTDEYMIDVKYDQDAERGLDKVITATYPVDPGTSDEIVYELKTPIRLNPGDTYTQVCEYQDPNTSRPCGLTSPVTFVAGTHYKFGSAGDMASQNLNANLDITTNFYSGCVVVEMTNIGTRLGFVNALVVEGRVIRFNDAVKSEYVLSLGGNRTIEVSMPYQDSEIFAENVRKMVSRVYGGSERVNSVTYNANEATPFSNYMGTDIGDKIAVTETMTGLSGYTGYINGESVVYKPGGRLDITYLLAPASTSTNGIWGTSKWGQAVWKFAEG